MSDLIADFWQFETANFTVTASALVEHDLDLSFDDSGEILAGLESGKYSAFCVRVTVSHDQYGELAAQYLGGCIYETFESFRDHFGVARQSREASAERGSPVSVGSYFSDMVREAIAEARDNLPTVENQLTAINRKLDAISCDLMSIACDDCETVESDPDFMPDDYTENSDCELCESDQARTECGTCFAVWCGDCDPSPSAQCHTCNGRGHSIASMKRGIVYMENGSPDLDQARSHILDAIESITDRLKESKS